MWLVREPCQGLEHISRFLRFYPIYPTWSSKSQLQQLRVGLPRPLPLIAGLDLPSQAVAPATQTWING